MMNIILRRCCSSSLAPKRALAALTSVQTILHHQLSAATSTTTTTNHFVVVRGRDFHVKSGPLDYKASVVSQAEYAVAESWDEDKGSSKGNSDEGLEVANLGIAQEIVTSLAKRGITKLFPIQKAVLEPAMQGRDMFGRARTGTGKTLAFGIPIMNRIIQFNAKHSPGKYPLALVMAPTRELARQVEKEFHESASSLETICVYGGTPISNQIRQLDYGVDVVVGTPGRIIDLLKRGSLILNAVQFVVLDEADQMLNVGFAEDVETILSKLPQNRQSMMFSATMPSWIKNLTKNYLKNPLTIDLVGDSDQKLADGISLYSIASDMYSKASIIGPLITEHAKGGKCIVFTQTKRDADRLAYAMGKSYRCEALHGDISQTQRERTLSGFRDGLFNILVATDVAARGLDVPNVDLIIHYELPTSSETFVHRSGRTGRAGKKGTAILIYTQDQSRAVKLIERDVGCRFQELPKIAVEGGSDMMNDMGGMRDRRYGDMGFGRSSGRGGDSGFGRSPGYKSPGFGRSSGNNSSFSGQTNGYGASSGRFGSSANRSGTGRSDRSSGFGSSFGEFGSGRSSGFGDSQSSRTGGGSGSRFGSFGDERKF